MGRVLFCAVFFLPIATSGVECLATDPVRVAAAVACPGQPAGSPGIRGDFLLLQSVESGSQVEILVLGFTAVPQNRTDTDVFVSRFLRSEDRWASPVPIAETKGLERSPEIWIDDQSGSGPRSLGCVMSGGSLEGLVVNSESATGGRRMEEPPGRPHGILPSGRHLRAARS